MQEDTQREEPKQKILPFIWELVKIAIIAFVIVAPIRYFLFQPFIVSGESMHPSFESGDYLIVDEISYRFSTPQRGDVVVFDASFIPGYAKQRFIKRIIGVPGETISIADGKVQVTNGGNTSVLDEKYLSQDFKTLGDKNVTLEANQYFVMGDNREFSYDSRMWGILSKDDIIGKAFVRIFPFNEMKMFFEPVY